MNFKAEESGKVLGKNLKAKRFGTKKLKVPKRKAMRLKAERHGLT